MRAAKASSRSVTLPSSWLINLIDTRFQLFDQSGWWSISRAISATRCMNAQASSKSLNVRSWCRPCSSRRHPTKVTSPLNHLVLMDSAVVATFITEGEYPRRATGEPMSSVRSTDPARLLVTGETFG